MKRLILIQLIILILLTGQGMYLMSAQEKTYLFDGFEEGIDWDVPEWSDAARLELSKDEVTQGIYALRVNYTPEGRKPDNKGIFLRGNINGTAGEHKEIIFDLYNDADNDSITAALALDIDEYYESEQIPVKKGWNKNVRFDLMQKTFKSASTGWQYSTKLKTDLNMGRIMIILYLNNSRSGCFYLDNIRSFKKPVSEEQPVILKQEETEKEKITKKKNSILPKIKLVKGIKETIEQYELMELTVDFTGSYTDPFDDQDIDVSAVFISPDKQIINIRGFLYSGKAGKEKITDPVWKIRFTPWQKGIWKYFIKVKNNTGQDRSSLYQINCRASGANGFIKVDKTGKYFEFDSGAFYYPIGQNIGWASLEEYQNYFIKMNNNKENWTRIWMANWNVGLEWKETGYYKGLGNYNLVNAERLDKIFQFAEKKNIYIQLVFDYHGAYNKTMNSEWNNNCYNAKLGGPCEKPEDFFISETARKYYKRRVQYILARWGYNTHLLAWELFNEVNFTENFNKERNYLWHQEMCTFIKENDPYRHLVTTSYYNSTDEKVNELPAIDYIQVHNYIPQITAYVKGLPGQVKKFNKPYFLGEFGGYTEDGKDDLDKKGVLLHAGIWAQFMQPAAGNAMPWWWNTHIEPNDLYFHFFALAQFAEGLDRRKYNFSTDDKEITINNAGSNRILELFSLHDEKLVLFWLCDKKGMNSLDQKEPVVFNSCPVQVNNLKNGNYQIEFWDTYKGTVIQKYTGKVSKNSIQLVTPVFKNDIACKIKKL